MAPETSCLGITGGEPTLLGELFFDLVTTCERHLRSTGLHILTNGRMFNYLAFTKRFAEIGHHEAVLGIPLYSDIAGQHDFVVQSQNAFDQTIRGILNLARYNQRLEVRVVIHRYTADHLPRLARFLTRNLPMVEHVALMGYEPIGFGKTNLESLWIDPIDYRESLTEAVQILDGSGMNASIYNHQLCTLPEELWPYAQRSISDWKNVYLPECEGCQVREKCGGFFHSAVRAFSRGIAPVRSSAVVETSNHS